MSFILKNNKLISSKGIEHNGEILSEILDNTNNYLKKENKEQEELER